LAGTAPTLLDLRSTYTVKYIQHMTAASPLQIATLDQVLELVVLLDADMTQALARDGLTKSRAPLVWALQQHGPSTQKALADRLGSTPRNVTGLVDGLVASGFVTREPHPTDRRATLVSLTSQGRAVMERMAADHDELARQLFAGLSRHELDAFASGLGSVLGVIRTHLDAEPEMAR
jgi:DNA-binding MarR family transcriptional regulator